MDHFGTMVQVAGNSSSAATAAAVNKQPVDQDTVTVTLVAVTVPIIQKNFVIYICSSSALLNC